jgi:TolB-like protein
MNRIKATNIQAWKAFRGGLALLIGVAFFSSGCASFSEYGKLHKSARGSYASCSYDESISKVAKSLRINPNYKKSQLLIQSVYPRATESHLELIEVIKEENAKFKWDKIAAEYEALQAINKDIKSIPALVEKKTGIPISLPVIDYRKELSQAKRSAAEEHYLAGRALFGKTGIINRDKAAVQFRAANSFVPDYLDSKDLAAEGYYLEGILLSRTDTLDSQKQAAKSFSAAQTFVVDYKDSASRYEKARLAGIKRVAIIPFVNKSGQGNQYGAIADTIVDGIVSKIMNDPEAIEFLEIISRDRLQQVMEEQKLGMSGLVDGSTVAEVGKVLGVHEILTGQINQLIISPERTTNKRIKETDEVVVGEREYTDDKGKTRTKNVWGDVSANVAIYSRTAGASISGSYKVIDVKTAKVKDTQMFKGSSDFACEWASCSGDNRALSDQSKELIQKIEKTAPVPAEMLNSAAEDLITSMAATLKKYAM